MRVKILGKCWTFRFSRMSDPGICDSPREKDKKIRINRKLRGKERLETILHELWHAANWNADEEFIHDAAHDVSAVLWRLGYRLPDDKE